MKSTKNKIRIIVYLLIILGIILYVFTSFMSKKLPDVCYVINNEPRNFSMNLFSVTEKNSSNHKLCANNIQNNNEKYTATLKFLNIIPVKNIEVNVIDPVFVSPSGTPFGVKIYTVGALVINTSTVKTQNGFEKPWETAGILKGDVITQVNQEKISNNQDLEKIIEKSNGHDLNLKILRDNQEFETRITPVKSIDDSKYHIGIWVRDSSAGIGTLTFYERKNNLFAGLGHGICDIDTLEILPVSHGDIVEANITEIIPGRRGVPGELKGCFVNSEPIGQIKINNQTGLYGVLNKFPEISVEIPVATKQNVKKGPAQILVTLDNNKPELYNINIDSVNYNINSPTQNIKFSVTDPRLLEKTGGIVQGMSGSPIIQNNSLIGAVTHVFVNNPTKGYAIFAETMLVNSNSLLNI